MELKEALVEIYKNLKERLGIEKDPKLILKHDEENSKNIFGRTAYYAPDSGAGKRFVCSAIELRFGLG